MARYPARCAARDRLRALRVRCAARSAGAGAHQHAEEVSAPLPLEPGRHCHVFVRGSWHRGTITKLIPARQGRTRTTPALVEIDYIAHKGGRHVTKVPHDRVQVDLF